MRIQSFHIEGFGVFQDLTLENLPPGLSIFLGKNEAGKSTLLNFFRYMFDASGNRVNSVVKNYIKNHGKAGGDLTVASKEHGRLRISKRQKSFALTDLRGNPAPLYLWETLFHGVTQEVYGSVYSFSLNELQELNSLRGESVRNALYGASFGAGISSPSLAIEKLGELMKSYATSRSAKKFDKELEELEIITNKIKNIEKDIVAYDNTQNELHELKRQKNHASEELKTLEQQAAVLKKRLDCQGKWEEWQKQQAELNRLSNPKKFPPEGASRLKEQINIKDEKIQQVTIIETSLDALRHELEKHCINATILEVETELLAALEYKASFITAEQTVANLQLTLEKKKSELQKRLEYLGEAWSVEKTRQTDHSLSARERFRSSHLKTQKAQNEYEELEKQTTDVCERLASIQQKEQETQTILKDLSQNQDEGSSSPTLKKALLRELREAHITYEKAMAAYNAYSGGDSSQNKNSAIKKSLPKATKLLGVLSLLGGTAYAVQSYFYTEDGFINLNSLASNLWLYFLLGVGAALFPALFLYKRHASLSRAQKIDRDGYRKSLDLEQKIQKICARLHILPEQISVDFINGLEDNIEYERHQIIQAEHAANLARAEKEALEKKLQALKERQTAYKKTYDDAWLLWGSSLKALDLQPDFSYSAVEAALDCMDAIETLDSDCLHIERTIAQHEKNKNAFILPLKKIAKRLNYPLEDRVDWIEFFTNIYKSLEQTRTIHTHQEHLKKEEKKLNAELTQAQIALKSVDEKIKALLNAAEAKDIEDFLHKGDIRQRYEKIRQTVAPLEDFFIHTFDCPPTDTKDFLRSFFKEDPSIVEKTYKERLAQINEASRRHDALSKQIHEREFLLKQLSSSTDLSQHRIKASQIKSSMHELARQWSRYSLAKELLMEAKLRFEQERQPEIIRAASTMFDTITHGKWKKINASLEDMSLKVMQNHGEPLDPSTLSRGTQEQLYLALRLAHIRNHAEQATPLPVIMDDILVNFDQERALSAIKTFMELLKPAPGKTEGHQILFFTCHERAAKQIQKTMPNSALYVIENKKIKPGDFVEPKKALQYAQTTLL